jgi:integrase/recombinase XerD
MENVKQKTIQELVFEVENYFKSISYHKQTIKCYQNGWDEIKRFMDENSIKYYEAKVGNDFIQKVFGNRSYSQLCRKEKDLIRCANVLIEYQISGCIKFRSISKTYLFNGEFGELVIDYLSFRKSHGISEDTIYNTKIYLHRFLEYLNSNRVQSLTALDKQHILGFINSLGFCTKSTIHCTLSSLRGFLKFLFDNQYLQVDLSYVVPKSSYKKEARLPTTYTKDEVNRLINSVDKSSPKGKRDVAMILLAARLGLRASDICGLKFENINVFGK